jgi:hypothetical protein
LLSLLSLCLSLILCLFDVCMFFHHSTFVLKILEFIFYKKIVVQVSIWLYFFYISHLQIL